MSDLPDKITKSLRSELAEVLSITVTERDYAHIDDRYFEAADNAWEFVVAALREAGYLPERRVERQRGTLESGFLIRSYGYPPNAEARMYERITYKSSPWVAVDSGERSMMASPDV